MKKTMFIIITRGFLIRNILRSGVLGYFKENGNRVVILIQTLKGRELPGGIKEEFEDKNVIIERIDSPPSNSIFERFYKIFVSWTSLLVYSNSTWAYSRAGNLHNRQRMFFWKYAEKAVFSILTKFDLLKTLTRWLEKKVFVSNFYSAYFDKYHPDLVFSTSITAGIDVVFMKEAAKRGIKTVSMTKGWDHASRVLYRFIPDKIVIQNFTMKDYMVRYQKIDGNRVNVCGFPQFDWYVKKDLFLSREEYFKSLGLDPKKKLIFFGSEGAWSPDDDRIAGMLVKLINAGVLSKSSGLLIRPHYSDIKTERYNRFIANDVKIDSCITYTDALPGNWDPGPKDIKHFVNLMYHSDVVVNIASTLTLDACCFDKPIVSVAFGALYNLRSGQDVTDVYYEMDHYRDVIETNAVDVVKTEEELLKSINNYLLQPGYKSGERKILLNKLCGVVDGKSAYRIYNIINSFL